MGLLTPFAAAPRQASLLFRIDHGRTRALLPDDLTAARTGSWGLLELACVLPPTGPVGADVALVAWRVAVEREDGVRGTWVLDRWTSARLGGGWPDRWVTRRGGGTETDRADWREDAGSVELEVRSGDRRLDFSAAPVDRPERSVFVTARQAERHLSDYSTVLNPHPLGRLLDPLGAPRVGRGLQTLALHRLDFALPRAGDDALLDASQLELDSAFRLVTRRRAPSTRTNHRAEPTSARESHPAPLQMRRDRCSGAAR
jgi:hypothetical protein